MEVGRPEVHDATRERLPEWDRDVKNGIPVSHGRGISKVGNPTVRKLLIQMAWR